MSALRILFVACDSGGHVTSMVAFAGMMRELGHEVFVLGTEPERTAAEGAGATLVTPEEPATFGLGAVLRRAFSASAPFAERLPRIVRRPSVDTFFAKRHRELVFRSHLPAIVERMALEVRRAARQVSADVVVADSLSFGAAYGAKADGRPYVSLGTDPAFSLDAEGVPFLLPHLALRRVPAWLWRRAVDRALPLREVRRRLDVAPQDFTAELYASTLSDELHLVVAPPGFNGVPSAPHTEFIGPLTYAAPKDPERLADRVHAKTVLVTGSTTGHPRGVLALKRTVAALARTSLDVVVAPGKLNGWSPSVPSNVALIDGFAPHDAMIPRAGVVVTHGGWGVVGRCLRAGTPVVVTPAFGPQDFVGERVHALGVGGQVALDELSGDALERACRRAMDDAAVRAASKAMAARLAALEPGRLAEASIRRLVERRRVAA